MLGKGTKKIQCATSLPSSELVNAIMLETWWPVMNVTARLGWLRLRWMRDCCRRVWRGSCSVLCWGTGFCGECRGWSWTQQSWFRWSSVRPYMGCRMAAAEDVSQNHIWLSHVCKSPNTCWRMWLVVNHDVVVLEDVGMSCQLWAFQHNQQDFHEGKMSLD